MVVTMQQVKQHLRLNPCENHEDGHLLLLIEAATDYASQFINRPIPWCDDNGKEVSVPFSVRAAILLIIGDLYENREGKFVGVSMTNNPTVENLLHFYRVGLGV